MPNKEVLDLANYRLNQSKENQEKILQIQDYIEKKVIIQIFTLLQKKIVKYRLIKQKKQLNQSKTIY